MEEWLYGVLSSVNCQAVDSPVPYAGGAETQLQVRTLLPLKLVPRARSSVGRASALQAEGRWFKSSRVHVLKVLADRPWGRLVVGAKGSIPFFRTLGYNE
jgi:hypothetical protein